MTFLGGGNNIFLSPTKIHAGNVKNVEDFTIFSHTIQFFLIFGGNPTLSHLQCLYHQLLFKLIKQINFSEPIKLKFGEEVEDTHTSILKKKIHNDSFNDENTSEK